MQIGTSAASCTVRSIDVNSSGSSTSGMPALTSSMSAPACTCASASLVTVSKLPSRSSSAKVLRPVGLMRSPMMQNGCSAPMVTVLDRDRSTVSIGFPFGSRGDAQTGAQLRDAGIPAERNEVDAPDTRLLERVGGELVGEVEALVLGIGGLLDAGQRRGRNVDAGHAGGDEAHAPDRAQ